MDDQADLAHLADIVVPPPSPWWPPAPGWWILAAAFLVAIAILGWMAARRYRANAYRREALAALADISPVATSAAEVSAILKRTALVAYPRTQVASLTGERWLAFLDRTGRTDAFSRGPAAQLAQAAFGAPLRDGAAALAASRRWVKQHRAEG